MAYRFMINILPTEKDQLVGASYAARFMRLIIEANRDEMRRARERGRPLPSLYDSGVRYDRKSGPVEEYTDCLTVVERGWGHCVDLVCMRVAEIQEAGGAADVRCYWRDIRLGANGRPVLDVHVELRQFFPNLSDPRYAQLARLRREVQRLEAELRAECLPSSKIEDPSRFLGM
jgi:hypothetical protein